MHLRMRRMRISHAQELSVRVETIILLLAGICRTRIRAACEQVLLFHDGRLPRRERLHQDPGHLSIALATRYRISHMRVAGKAAALALALVCSASAFAPVRPRVSSSGLRRSPVLAAEPLKLKIGETEIVLPLALGFVVPLLFAGQLGFLAVAKQVSGLDNLTIYGESRSTRVPGLDVYLDHVRR